ncbi:cyanophycinase [Bacillus fengqiuensis]|nr:cyanophycinase [Bacillus fengqiuensis]
MKKRVVSCLVGLSMLTSMGNPVMGQAKGKQEEIKGKQEEIKGNLVIAGGALGSSNKAVYEKFIELAGGKENAKIGIVPAASGKLKSSQDFKRDLLTYGLNEANIEILPLSDHDFSDTKEVDESKWKDHINQTDMVKKVSDLTAIWFVGGDQLRITSTLRTEKGKDSKVLDAIWDIYRKGAVIGGTSAGAAIMSDVMITGGDSLGALKEGFTSTDISDPDKEYAPVYVQKGLGFFQYGIVDQHFDERGRLGRLALTAHAYETRKKERFAYGVDEDTALVVYNEEKEAEIIGRSGVAVVDVSKAKKKSNPKTHLENVNISYLAAGDRVHLDERTFEFPASKSGTKGYEYYDFQPLPATGVMTPYGRLKNYLAYSLVDHGKADHVKSYLYDSKGEGFELNFRKIEKTNGYWGYADGQKDDYSIVNVVMDIKPVSVAFQQAAKPFSVYQPSQLELPEVDVTEPIKGSLVIVGGALGSSNRDVYESFIELAGGKENAKIGIVPAASSSFSSSENFKRDLAAYGVKEENIHILPISNHDFKKTAEDESVWKDNMNNKEVVKQVEGLSAIWFVGGDQTLITRSLLNEDGTDSKVLEAIWDVYKKGAVIGGTSAGAAIMSDVMLAGGDSYGTLMNGFTDTYDGMTQQEGGPGYLERGLGFFRYGIVDQHFDNKARLGRLIATAYEQGKKQQLAYGIDEDTALVVDNETHTAKVAGRGGVTLVDVSKTTTNPQLPNSNYQNIVLSWMAPGDSVDFNTKDVTVSANKVETKGYEYNDYQVAPHSGVLSAHGLLNKFLAYELVDNSGEEAVKSYSFAAGKGFELTFRKGEETNGYWAYTDGQKDDYSVEKVVLDITSVEVHIK